MIIQFLLLGDPSSISLDTFMQYPKSFTLSTLIYNKYRISNKSK